jgi:ribosome-associated toxin RatA of RatAB toxin-antitoxin module
MFRALGDAACKTSLRLHFELTSGLANAAAGKLFDKVALDLVDAVVRRANQELQVAT